MKKYKNNIYFLKGSSTQKGPFFGNEDITIDVFQLSDNYRNEGCTFQNEFRIPNVRNHVQP